MLGGAQGQDNNRSDEVFAQGGHKGCCKGRTASTEQTNRVCAATSHSKTSDFKRGGGRGEQILSPKMAGATKLKRRRERNQYQVAVSCPEELNGP